MKLKITSKYKDKLLRTFTAKRNKLHIIYYSCNKKEHYVFKYLQSLKNFNQISVTAITVLKNETVLIQTLHY